MHYLLPISDIQYLLARIFINSYYDRSPGGLVVIKDGNVQIIIRLWLIELHYMDTLL